MTARMGGAELPGGEPFAPKPALRISDAVWFDGHEGVASRFGERTDSFGMPFSYRNAAQNWARSERAARGLRPASRSTAAAQVARRGLQDPSL